MTYKLKNILTFAFFFMLICLIITNTKVVSNSVISSANIFFYKLFPSLFPFFILSEFLINYNFNLIDLKIKKEFKKIIKEVENLWIE